MKLAVLVWAAPPITIAVALVTVTARVPGKSPLPTRMSSTAAPTVVKLLVVVKALPEVVQFATVKGATVTTSVACNIAQFQANSVFHLSIAAVIARPARVRPWVSEDALMASATICLAVRKVVSEGMKKAI